MTASAQIQYKEANTKRRQTQGLHPS